MRKFQLTQQIQPHQNEDNDPKSQVDLSDPKYPK